LIEVVILSMHKKMIQMKNAFLIGEQVYLRPLEERDLTDDYLKWVNDPEVTTHMSAGLFPQTMASLKSYFDSAMAEQAARGGAYFAIVDKKNDKHIGNTQIYKIDWRNNRCEFGILIGDKSYWGMGICREVLMLLTDYAFTKLNLRKICIGVIKDHAAAVKCYASVGFKQEGEQREMWFDSATGKYSSNLWFGLLKDEYMANKNKSMV
jgi:RimJ/RimL family protein N-acetyltransferase